MTWLKLGFVCFPNKTGKGFLRVWVKCLILALVKYTQPSVKERKNVLRTSPLKSNIWNSFNCWLHFQIKYINQRDWARSPVVLAVAGGYSEKLSLSSLTYSKFDKAIAEQLAQKYLSGFNGFQQKNYENWILKYLIFVRLAEKMTKVSLLNPMNNVAEIGPGMASMIGIANAHSSPKFFSYDTVEMQTIQRYVTRCLKIPKEICTFFPINLEKAKSKADPVTSPYVLFAFWSLTEVDFSQRSYYHDLIQGAHVAVIACNESFEGVNNFEYLENLAVALQKEIQYQDFLDIFGREIPGYQQKHRLYVLKDLST